MNNYSIHAMTIKQTMTLYWDAIEYLRDEEAIGHAKVIARAALELLASTEAEAEARRQLREKQTRG